MFPSDQIDDYLYEISDIPHHEDFVRQNLTSGESVEGSHLTRRTGKGKGLKSLAVANNNDANYAVSANDAKKIARKEIERERRQQMGKLYQKLRSLLPPESIKGKRAASDHMNEAVNYITYMKKRIGELSIKRDKVKKLSNRSALDLGSSSASSSGINSCVVVHPFRGGVEIMISSGFGDQSWHLSTVLQAILEEGLDVVRCVSSQTIEGLLHTVQSEVTDPTQIDLSRLQTKLNDLISYYDNAGCGR